MHSVHVHLPEVRTPGLEGTMSDRSFSGAAVRALEIFAWAICARVGWETGALLWHWIR